ncbi:MAG: aminodeoxychorismate synthase component I [Clostridia bacterium]|nr:aminodeoxychorismate synthase component I [Clostridia bacterium]
MQHLDLGARWSPEELGIKVAAQPNSFWLDSGLSHRRYGRYSFFGWDPFLVVRSEGRRVSVISEGRERTVAANPFELLKELLAAYRLPPQPELPPLWAGAVGYFGYDLCRHLERLPRTVADDLNLPDLWLGFYDRVLVYDHRYGRATVFSTGLPAPDGVARRRRARQRLEEARAVLEAPPPGGGASARPEPGPITIGSNFRPEDYVRAVARAREYIFAGDIFQVNLTQRFEAPLTTDPLSLYLRLRRLNPAPYAAYLNPPGMAVASSSPERFLCLRGRRVETRPIKGTRPRGTDPASDRALKRELWASEKDRAELAMIVDLERNDLGRTCEIGSVRVQRLYCLETYATVFHLVATVVGTLAPDRDFLDCLAGCFPGGSITGAPKIRAMEIIDELETVSRGVYTGAIGYVSFTGEAADLNIAIRTMVIKGDRVYFGAGGGIVADSVPELEYEESVTKARALMAAVQGGVRTAGEGSGVYGVGLG